MILENDGVRAELLAEGTRLEVRFRDVAELVIRLPRALAPAPTVVARGRIKTSVGPAERLEILNPGAGESRRLVLELEATGTGLVVELDAGTGAEPTPPLEVSGPAEPVRVDPDGAWVVAAATERWLLLGLLSGEDRLLTREAGTWRAPAGARLWLRTGPSPDAVLEAWAERVAAERGARLVPRGGVSWPGGGASERLGLTAATLPDPIGELAAPAAAGRQAVRRVRDLAAHAHESARLWHLAPAPIGGTADDLPRLESQLSLASLGGYAELASSPDSWPAAAVARARRALPPLARTIRALPGGGLVAPLRHGRLAVWLGNHGSEPAEIGLTPDLLTRLGPGPFVAYDFWPDRALGRIEREVPPTIIPPGGGRLLGLSPCTEGPGVIGSRLHLGMGTLEVAQLAWQADRWQLRLRHPGRHEGNVWIQHPALADPLRVPVAFEDQTQVPLDLPPP